MKIGVFTSTRADYGLLRSVIRSLALRNGSTVRTIATGTHFDSAHGNTVTEIEHDGFAPIDRLEIPWLTQTPQQTCQTIAVLMGAVSQLWSQDRPDWLVVLGDRFELIPVVQAAVLHGIRVAHIHGGEVTQGALDERFRHAVTKLADLHLVAHSDYANRVMQLGENPQHVVTVGFLGMEAALSLALPSASDLMQRRGMNFTKPTALVTIHPETAGTLSSAEAQAMRWKESLDALTVQFPELAFIVTHSNSDLGAEPLWKQISAWTQENPARVRLVSSLGQVDYLAALKQCAFVFGNSSSGMMEAPALGVQVVNVGTRQQGRIRFPGVCDCELDPQKIAAVVKGILKNSSQVPALPLEFSQNVSQRIVETVEKKTNESWGSKPFFDWDGSNLHE